MCLDIDINIHGVFKRSSPKIVEQPIMVYKRLSRATKTKASSPYQGAEWLFGVENSIHHFTYGYSYDWCDNAKKFRSEVEAGLHAYTKEDFGCFGDAYPAVIPVGAKIWIGLGGEVAADRMTVYRDRDHMLKSLGLPKNTPDAEGISRHDTVKKWKAAR